MQQCVETAGVGQYPESAAAELSPERLERFFVKKGDNFVIKNDLRQCIVFARHNLLADPPFTRMDLVACRNTFIYFKSAAQERALRYPAVRHQPRAARCCSAPASRWRPSPKACRRSTPSTSCSGGQGRDESLPLLERKGRSSYHADPGHEKHDPTGEKGRRRHERQQRGGSAGTAALLAMYTPPAIVVNHNHEADAPLWRREYLPASPPGCRQPGNQPPAAGFIDSGCGSAALQGGAGSLFHRLRPDRCDAAERRVAQPCACPRIRCATESEERLALLCFETRLPGTRTSKSGVGRCRCRNHGPRQHSRTRTGRHPREPAGHHRGAGNLQRGTAGHQRRAHGLQRGTAKLERGTAVGQRRDEHGQLRVPGKDAGPESRQRRPRQHGQGRGRGHHLPGRQSCTSPASAPMPPRFSSCGNWMSAGPSAISPISSAIPTCWRTCGRPC
jgi:hypothetical protein